MPTIESGTALPAPWTVDELVPGGIALVRSWHSSLVRPRPLSPFTEKKCAELAKEGNRDAEEILVGANIRYVVWAARKVRGSGEIADLIAAGAAALLHAVRSYDPESGCRLVAFADRGIYRAILRAINGERLVDLPQYVSVLGVNIRKFEGSFFARFGREPTEEELVERFGLAGDDILIARNETLVLLDMPVGEDGQTLFSELYKDPDQAPADQRAEVRSKWAAFMKAFLWFSEENQKIIMYSFGVLGKEKMPVVNIARMLGMSVERVVKRRDAILQIIQGLVQEGKKPADETLYKAGELRVGSRPARKKPRKERGPV
jgi:RNA polymerase sigma factor (sigma-70 family)